MTLRRKLGSWIAGVDIDAMGVDRSVAEGHAFCLQMEMEILQHALNNIELATRNGKSGTARKINRMARAALGMDDKPVKLGA